MATRQVLTAEQVTRNKAKSRASRPAAEPGGASPKAKRHDHDKGGRWQTFNQFVDVIAPHLSLAERAVWLVVFRVARNGVCETSERRLAVACRIEKKTAGRALRELVALRLVWPVYLSASKEQASKYGLHPTPADRLAEVLRRGDGRTSRGSEPGSSRPRLKVGTGVIRSRNRGPEDPIFIKQKGSAAVSASAEPSGRVISGRAVGGGRE